jgi:hypothetical protein
MKLRIQGNSIRLRLGPREIERLLREGTIEESVAFGPVPAQRLAYSLHAADVKTVSAVFENNCLAVRLPRRQLQQWAASEQVGIQATQAVDGNAVLSILIEKDFECLDKAHAPARDDVFGNPNSRHA